MADNSCAISLPDCQHWMSEERKHLVEDTETMAAQSKKQRNADQADRQHEVRKKARQTRRPSRDDIARLWLWQVISDAQKDGKEGKALIAKMADKIVAGLEAQGFDDDESYDVFGELVRKYSDGLYPFRPKRYLVAPSENG